MKIERDKDGLSDDHTDRWKVDIYDLTYIKV